MKKNILLIAAIILASALSGCAEKAVGQDAETTVTESSEAVIVTTVTTTASETETVAETEAEITEEAPFSLETIDSEQKKALVEKLLAMETENGEPIFYQNAVPYLFNAVSQDEFKLGQALELSIYRKSTCKTCTDSDLSSSFFKDIEVQEKGRYAADLIDAQNIRNLKDSPAIVKLDVDESLEPEIVCITSEYTASETAFNAFVCKDKSGGFKVIVDPAYMYNIPVPIFKESYEENINGTQVLMDSISFTADDIYDCFDYSDYVYARIVVDELTVSYDSLGNNYSHAPTITSFSLIYEDGARALSEVELAENFEGKNDASAIIYKTLIQNSDIFMADDVVGVNLIDLDFDGTPEVFVAKDVTVKHDDTETKGADVDVYTISDGKLNYIDTLKSFRTQIWENGNVIGLKETDSLEKKWFFISRSKAGEDEFFSGDVAYLITLKDGKLNYEEVFRLENDEYYFYGEKLEFDSYQGSGPYEDEDDWTYYTWNGITATFGEWELWGFIKENYCEDIKYVYSLYSDWLISDTVGYEYEKLAVDERTMNYKLAYLVDSFYYGRYMPEEFAYRYEFLGDYAKPVIYLYPEQETEVSVKVELNDGALTCTYPDYRDGWNVTAYPDGTLIDADGEEYYCLYWEGIGKADWDMSKGFVVKREDTADFLRSKLKEIGLTPRESNEFIIYWLPELQKNECNFITFQTEQYEKNAALDIDPVPDSILRIFMVYDECSADKVAEPQEFDTFERNGFTVVEWGGSHS